MRINHEKFASQNILELCDNSVGDTSRIVHSQGSLYKESLDSTAVYHEYHDPSSVSIWLRGPRGYVIKIGFPTRSRLVC